MATKSKKNVENIVGYVKVIKSNYYVRKLPNSASDALCKVADGDTLNYLGKVQKGWYKVQLTDGQIGWLATRAGIAKEVELVYKVVAKDKTVIRAANNSKAAKLGVVNKGDKVLYQDVEDNGWLLVAYENQNGWISKKAVE